MSNTYTTDWQFVTDGETTTINPQDLVTQSGYIRAENAEIQWRGDSDFFNITKSGSRYNRDTDEAEIITNKTRDVNEATATSSETVDTVTESFSKTVSESGSYGEKAHQDVFVEKPDIPDNVTVNKVTIRYYLDEDTGGDDSGISVQFDDDPYDAANYDQTESGLTVDGSEKKKIFENTSVANNSLYQRFDGASIRILDNGDNFGTVGVIAEFEVSGQKEINETNIETETATVTFPDVDGVNSHRLVVEYSDNIRSVTKNYDSGGKVGDSVSYSSPNSAGESVTVRAFSYGETRTLDPAVLSVQYPSVPSGFNFDNHDIHRDGYGNDFDTIYDNREGETKTERPNVDENDGEVELELETEYSKTITKSDDTVNPTIEGDYIEEGFNTDKVLFVIDKSESVAGSDRKTIAKDILSDLPDSTVASLLSFNFDSEVTVSKDTLDNNRSSIEDEIENLPSNGGTDIEQAIELARDNIGNGSDEGTIILITDGNNVTEATDLASTGINFDFISIGVTNNIDTEFLQNLTSLLDGVFFEGSITETQISTRLNNDELSSWQQLSGFTSGEQTLTHSIQESQKAEFRIRFDWVFETPEPIYGRTGFYDDSAGVWRECAVTDVNSNSLEYNHISVYNDNDDDWGALDVVDLSNDAAIEAFAFYDEDVGWLAPREYETV